MRIAILEDDQDQAKLFQSWLEEENHRVKTFHSGKDILHALRSDSYDLLLLDWLMPDMNGLSVLHWTRSHYDWRVPVISSPAWIVRMILLKHWMLGQMTISKNR